MLFDRESFGLYLRRERERRGISLDDITARTKIATSILAKLERGDLTGWPPGIFRRSFFRDYAAAIGLDGDGLMNQFLRLFPEPGIEPEPRLEAANEPSARVYSSQPPLRLTLDAGSRFPPLSATRLRRALLDTAGILAVGLACGTMTGHLPVVVAIVAVLYHAGTTVLGRAAVGVPRRAAAPGPRLIAEQASGAADDVARWDARVLRADRWSRAADREPEPASAETARAVS